MAQGRPWQARQRQPSSFLSSRRSSRSEVGQFAIETVVLVMATVLALVAMAVYVQRAYSGYLLANGQIHGLQFVPPASGRTTPQPYTETRTLKLSENQSVTVNTQGVAVAVLTNSADQPTLPLAEVPLRSVVTDVRTTNCWRVNSRTAYGQGAALPAPGAGASPCP